MSNPLAPDLILKSDMRSCEELSQMYEIIRYVQKHCGDALDGFDLNEANELTEEEEETVTSLVEGFHAATGMLIMLRWALRQKLAKDEATTLESAESLYNILVKKAEEEDVSDS